MYEIKLEISDINIWYRNSTKEWVVEVNYNTQNICGIVRYASKKLNKVKSSAYRNLHKDILKLEIEELIKNNKIKWVIGGE